MNSTYIQTVDGIEYRLAAPFDMSFIGRYGRVFKVLDNQDSGNICFGTDKNGKRYFVKFAGAPTVRYDGAPADAVGRLKAAVAVYHDLHHPNLVCIIDGEEIEGGYAAVFDWTDAECMGKLYPQSRKKILQLQPDVKMRMFEEILTFHAHTARQCYVAVDFYDGSIMYDFKSKKTVICDIDFYAKAPFINRMGRLWGSSRFMSPEEFTLGAEIDEISNVYAMGATAFALFPECDRTPGRWPLSEALYQVVHKAVSEERSERQQSIEQLIAQWNRAKA